MSEEDKSSQTVVEIKSEQHNSKKIERLILSPNYKYAATWSEEDKSICGWQLNDHDQLFELDRSCSVDKICKDLKLKISTTKLWCPVLAGVSNDKLVAIHLYSEEFDNGRIVIVDLKTENKIIKPVTSFLDNPIEDYWLRDCIFYDNGDFVVEAFTPRQNILNILRFSNKNLSNNRWKINKSIFIEPTNLVWNYLYDNESFMLLDTNGTLTQWKLNTLLFEKQYHMGLNRVLKRSNVTNMISIVNKTSTLFAIFLEISGNSITNDIIISVYLIKNSSFLSQCEYRKKSDLLHFEFISFDEGEKLLLFFENNWLEIRDPYNLKLYQTDNASNFFKELSNSNEDIEKFKMLKNEKIYIVSDRQILVQEISKQQWIKYLREKLGDQDEIKALPRKSQIEDFLQTIIDEYDKYESIHDNNIENQTYESKNLLVKWIVTQDKDKNLTIVQAMKAKKYEPAEEDWESVDEWEINSEYLSDQNQKFIYKCKLLDNGDLIMITSIGLLILTIRSIEEKDKIRLRYYKGSGFPFNQKYIDYMKGKRRVRLEEEEDDEKNKSKYKVFIADRETILKLLDDIKDLPSLSPDFQSITTYRENRDLCIFSNNEANPFQDLLDDYFDDKLTLSTFGELLLNAFLKNNDDIMIERMMEKSTDDKLIISLYGQTLLNKFLKNNDNMMIERLMETLYKQCIIKKAEEGKDINLLTNINLLEIVTFKINELSMKYPDILNQFLSTTALIPISMNKNIAIENFSSKSHLQSIGYYSQPSNISLINKIITRFKTPFVKFFKKKSKKTDDQQHQSIILIFPLPKFSCYPSEYNPLIEIFFPKFSPFANYESSELYKWWSGQAIINFKWNTYGKYYFIAIFILYSIFMVCFLIVATLENELSKITQEQLLLATIILGAWHIFIEFRHLICHRLRWIKDPWNWFDAVAIVFPVYTSITWLESSTFPVWSATISILFLEIRFLLFFRVFEILGAYFAMIIGVAQKAFSFLVILAFIIFAFSHSLHILLRPTTNVPLNATNINLNNPNYANDQNNPWNLVTSYHSVSVFGTVSQNASLTELPSASTNMFTSLYTAFLAVYLMLTGDKTYVTKCNAIPETNRNELYLLQKAKILSEIELLYMLPSQRRKNNWFPEIIFYKFDLDKLHNIIQKVQNNKWDDIDEKPFLSDSLKKLVNIKTENDDMKNIYVTKMMS
ncbi:transient receptor potential cation channel subfamily a member 1-like [Gigaspora margarita]|uniref:Transient receptor potential cation channel subfamily a member 1-like n=1 Tax=Gigaspora margarita TaxID=4874 RepID=A0A8H4AP41_GIGMA|nr:transient receptor potential cation channel subfamily a member 1-like [Gigaspora margarita]